MSKAVRQMPGRPGRVSAAQIHALPGGRWHGQHGPIDLVVGADGARYLACGLCATQWHYVRIKCAHCQSLQAFLARRVCADGAALP